MLLHRIFQHRFCLLHISGDAAVRTGERYGWRAVLRALAYKSCTRTQMPYNYRSNEQHKMIAIVPLIAAIVAPHCRYYHNINKVSADGNEVPLDKQHNRHRKNRNSTTVSRIA